MAIRNNPWQSYRQVSTLTASPAQVVLMLYDGAIRFVELSISGFTKEDPIESVETINNNIQKAQAIINELNVSLNMREGGEFADRMRALYNYMDDRLQQSNLRKTETGLREVIKHLTVIRDAWSQMLREGGKDMQEARAFAPALA
jgi:flagellar protein FliS